MSDYAKATAAPASMKILGKEYAVYKLRPRDIGYMEQWFREVIPNPRKEATEYMKGLSDSMAMHIWNQACLEEWPPSFDSPEANRLLMSAEGQARMLFVCLRRGFADGQFTLENARDIAEQLDLESVSELMRLVAPGDATDPLPESPVTPESPASP